MSWIDDYKGEGPWDFKERADKWGYLNNPNWTADLAHPDMHLPCGHWHKRQSASLHKFDAGRWVAAKSRIGTPYIYLYDIEVKAVVKLKTLTTMDTEMQSYVIVTEMLALDSLYNLDHSMGGQRGGYCISKDGNYLWYLFRDASGNCQLIEVDISQNTMEIVRKTNYSTLVIDQTIQDGCTDGNYTYWCTNRLAGRIIKIRNSDHVIMDDHLFNFDLYECALNEQGINSIDVNINTEKLYWNYVLDHINCSPVYNACVYCIISDLDFNIELNVVECGTGTSSPFWQTLVRIHSDSVLQSRTYHPFCGLLQKKDLNNYNVLADICQEAMANILSVKSGKLYTLRTEAIGTDADLFCIDFNTMTEILKLDVTSYTQYSQTFVSVMNDLNDIIVLFRYNNTEDRNYAVCFRADATLELLSDAALDYIEEGGNLQEILNEPQIWTF